MNRINPWLFVLIAITLLHALALPVILSYDSQLYIDQALMLGTSRFWTDWHFLRTPLFQLMTRIGFITFGERPFVLLLVPVALGFFGLLFLQRLLSKLMPSRQSWMITIFVACSPTLIAYQHCFLTESGSFFFLVLITLAFVACVERNFSAGSCLLAGISVACGYYFRPTLLILSVVTPGLYLIFGKQRSTKRFFLVAVLGFGLPQLLSVPWLYLGSFSHWEGDQVIFGVINQAVLPVDSPYLGNAREAYIEAMKRSLVHGSLSTSGIDDGDIYQFIGLLHDQTYAHPTEFFLKVIVHYPLRYLKGIIRGELLLLGIPGIDSDNTIFETSVFEDGHPVIFPGPPKIGDYVKAHFATEPRPHPFFFTLYRILSPLYSWVYRVGAFLLIPLLGLSYLKDNKALFALCASPFIFITYHAIVLFSLDRMAAPASPIVMSIAAMIVNLWICRWSQNYAKPKFPEPAQS